DVNGAHLEASGRVSRSPEQADVNTRFQADLATLPLPSSWSLQGHANGAAHVTGTFARLRADGDMQLAGLQLSRGGGGQAVLGVPEGRLQLRGDRLRWPPPAPPLAAGALTPR